MQTVSQSPGGDPTQSVGAPVDLPTQAQVARLQLAFSTLPVVLGVTMGSGIILVFLLRQVCSVVELGAWLAALSAVTALRFAHYRLFHRGVARKVLDTSVWHRRFNVGAAASGIVWGYAGAGLFPSGSLPHQIFIAFILAGLSAGAMTAYSAVPRAYLYYVLPVVLPLIVRFTLEGTEIHYSMAALTLLYLAVVVRSSLESSRLFESVFRTQSENIELTKALQYQATHDSLVDLPNHREFNRRLEAVASAASAGQEPYALLFVDLDRFKAVNDGGGHAAGDEILRRIGRILKGQIRTDDTAARVGGDEFAVLLQRCPREQAERVARNVLGAIDAFELEWEGSTYRVGASIGVAYTDAGEHNAAAILRAADAACYAAKSGGRGRIEVYHSDPIYESSGRFHLDELRS